MNTPIRVVCEGCLRSFELAPGCVESDGVPCPSCGRRVNRRTSEAGYLGFEGRALRTGEDSETADATETIDWAAAWTRGNLGSLGRFQLRERLGDGGFGQVYLAYDPRLDRDVALKVLKQPDPNSRVMERFFREARAVARLDHPNIVAVHDAGFEGGRCWVAYQLVGGRPLWWYRDRQRMDPMTAARILRDLADAVDHAHRMGVVHRDIKPGNVMIDDRGRPRLIDFGLARRSDVESDLTRDGVVVGTPTYMSPEQAIGLSKQADERSDVYSLGVIFYEVLSGRRPQELWARTGDLEDDPGDRPRPVPSVRTFHRAVPRRLDAICARAMAPRPSDRYPTARALAEALDRWLESRRGRARRLAVAALALLLSMGGGGAAMLLPRLGDGSGPIAIPMASVAAAGESMPRSTPEPPAPKDLDCTVIEASAAGAPLLGNRAKKKYHLPDCWTLEKSHRNRLIPLRTPEEALEAGLDPCGHCHPPEVSPPTPLDR